VFDQLVDQVSSGWSAYPLIFLIVMGDAILPILPGETAIITGAIFSSSGDLSWALVLLSGALGAFAGDNAVYWIGRVGGPRVTDRFFRSEKAKARLDWARRQLEERGATIIASARFIPGGRTATTFTAGGVEFPWRRFAVADAVGALLWSGFATGLGYVGGQAFKNSLWKPLLLALAFAALVGLVGEAVRRARASRS
jgi:membrane protein DedA with SNARE-associated domain